MTELKTRLNADEDTTMLFFSYLLLSLLVEV